MTRDTEHTITPPGDQSMSGPAADQGRDAQAAFAAATEKASARRQPGAVEPGSDMTLELRVLAGPQTGARAPLAKDASLVIATGLPEDGRTADVLLLDETDAVTCIELVPAEEAGCCTVKVNQGQVSLSNRPVNAGEQLTWVCYQRLTIGAVVLAFGPAEQTDWPDPQASRQVAPGETNESNESNESDESAQPTKPTESTSTQRQSRPLFYWMGAAGLIVAALLITGVAIMVPAQPQTADTPAPADLSVMLADSPFNQLTVKTDEVSGVQTIHGRLADRAALDRLNRWLAVHDQDPMLQIALDDDLVHDVSEVFRVNGVTVDAQLTGPGQVHARVKELDTDKLTRASEAVQRDVPGLRELVVKNTAKPRPPAAPRVPDDPNKRIVSMVAGASGYLVTADGSRYFIGAMLPNGHRVARIQGSTVTLERDGQRSKLKL